MKMTKELLAELGSCGEYVRVFRRNFPVEQYPEGVEINEEVCATQADQFQWSWAVEQMLTYDGQREWRSVLNELQDEVNQLTSEFNAARRAWREQYGRSEPEYGASETERESYRQLRRDHDTRLAERKLSSYEREARAFGRVFDTMPEHRNPRVIEAQERAVQQIEANVISGYDDLTRRLHASRADLARLSDYVPQLEAEEAELRVRYVPAKARQQAAKAALLADRATEATKLATEAQTRADEAKADAEKLAAEAEAILNPPVTEATEAEVETTTDDTASTANETETPNSGS